MPGQRSCFERDSGQQAEETPTTAETNTELPPSFASSTFSSTFRLSVQVWSDMVDAYRKRRNLRPVRRLNYATNMKMFTSRVSVGHSKPTDLVTRSSARKRNSRSSVLLDFFSTFDSNPLARSKREIEKTERTLDVFVPDESIDAKTKKKTRIWRRRRSRSSSVDSKGEDRVASLVTRLFPDNCFKGSNRCRVTTGIH